jgi:hypothetical protein
MAKSKTKSEKAEKKQKPVKAESKLNLTFFNPIYSFLTIRNQESQR